VGAVSGCLFSRLSAERTLLSESPSSPREGFLVLVQPRSLFLLLSPHSSAISPGRFLSWFCCFLLLYSPIVTFSRHRIVTNIQHTACHFTYSFLHCSFVYYHTNIYSTVEPVILYGKHYQSAAYEDRQSDI
jgi:hypothetical protein